MRERAFPRTCGHACASATQPGMTVARREGTRVACYGRVDVDEELSERRRDASHPRPSVPLTARADSRNPVQVCSRSGGKIPSPVTLTRRATSEPGTGDLHEGTSRRRNRYVLSRLSFSLFRWYPLEPPPGFHLIKFVAVYIAPLRLIRDAMLSWNHRPATNFLLRRARMTFCALLYT